MTRESIVLSLVKPADAAAVLEFELQNRAFFEHWIASRGDAFYSLTAVTDSLKSAAALAQAGREYHYLAWFGEQLVGRLTLRGIETEHYNKASLGYRFSQAHGGRGFASSAVKQLCHIAFTDLQLRRIEAQVIIDNLPSRAIMQKCGFRQFGHAHSAVIRHQQWHDLLHFELLNPAFQIP